MVKFLSDGDCSANNADDGGDGGKGSLFLHFGDNFVAALHPFHL
nr:hypothetical protein [Microcystis flos-aquae]